MTKVSVNKYRFLQQLLTLELRDQTPDTLHRSLENPSEPLSAGTVRGISCQDPSPLSEAWKEEIVKRERERNRDVPRPGQHGDTALLGTARSGTVPTRPDTDRHGPAWRGLAWLIEVRGLANRSEGSGQ